MHFLLKSTFTLLLTLLILPQVMLSNAHAHGVAWELIDNKSYVFAFTYSDGTPMAMAEVEVYAPSKRNEPKRLMQKGYTDTQGRFAFMPTEAGKWTVQAKDNTGHLAVAMMIVKEYNTNENGKDAELVTSENLNDHGTKTEFYLKIFLVLSILINIALGSMYFKNKKNK